MDANQFNIIWQCFTLKQRFNILFHIADNENEQDIHISVISVIFQLQQENLLTFKQPVQLLSLVQGAPFYPSPKRRLYSENFQTTKGFCILWKQL